MPSRSPNRPTFALLTDFGLSDPYVGQMTGALLRLAPEAAIIDLCHGVVPGLVAQAAFFLAASLPHLPDGAIVLAVVDPGVGTNRRIVCLQTPTNLVLAPDNGLLTLLLNTLAAPSIFNLTPAPMPNTISSTFHGRDLFAPLAAQLAQGASPADLGPALDPDSLVRLPFAHPAPDQTRLDAHVLHVDQFGNAILNLPVATWQTAIANASPALISPAPRRLAPVAAYADIPQHVVGILAGSQGYMELAMNRASAARELGLTIAAKLTLTLNP